MSGPINKLNESSNKKESFEEETSSMEQSEDEYEMPVLTSATKNSPSVDEMTDSSEESLSDSEGDFSMNDDQCSHLA